ncbi:MAG: tRNA (adenosine(37)-N6)-threonylcarbamoyltransferase complex dimerization subunit type 1 TsaB [Chloroflexi bacterium]|nr:MAG: tRNA (adenosine(37)-N6)-threonylcarbamoyltransferase complex dimerization subunit type 1 TsaB [Chloroflexota bacterium]
MLLALDTATEIASVSIYDLNASQLLAEWTWQARRRQTQDLLATAEHMLASLGLTPPEVTALAVTTGPGSFTGVRIAISAVKGIALGLSASPRVVGVPTLCVTALPWLGLAAQLIPPPQVCAYLQAGRGRYNWAFFSPNNMFHRPGVSDHYGGSIEEFSRALASSVGPLWLVGELDTPVARAAAVLDHVAVVDAVSGWRRAGSLAQLAVRRLAAGLADDLKTLQPLYLRNP